jgi:hypothetical protein
MKIKVILFLFVICGCSGSLPDEQRKQMHERMEMNKIVRVTEVEITEAAFSEGRSIVTTLDSLRNDSARVESFVKINDGRVRYITAVTANARSLERQLLEAYLADQSGTMQDNVQKVRNEKGDFDTLLYTHPVIGKLSDGRERLVGIWSIWLPKKELVLKITKGK